MAAINKSTAKYCTCGRIGHFASDHGKQFDREKEEKKKKKKEDKGRNRWKKGKGKNSPANVSQNDLDVSNNEDFIFLAWDPTLAQSLG